MPSGSAETQLASFLSSVSPQYRHPDLTKRDVLGLLHHYKGLTPKGEKFIFNDGRERELLHLVGTIPVPYKGQTYNIPISVTLLDTHPYHAPMAFVKPTADMQIKVSKHVDASGKIYLPYLHEWNHPSSDLLGLVQICVITFSEQPPVFAKPKQPAGNLPYPVHGGPQGGYPPQPGGYAGAQPGYPQQGYPPYPSYGVGGGPGPGYPPTTNSYNAGGGYPPVASSYQNPPAGGYPPPSSYPPTTQSYDQRPGTGTITADHIRISILSAVEDKVKRRLREDISQSQAEVDSLRKVQEELNQGNSKLTSILQRVKSEESELSNNIRVLEMKQNEMSGLVDKIQDGDEINCDEAVIASNPLYKQLMNAFAEESATEDAIYFLGEALRKGTIDVDVFLKQVRDVSRKQFMLRATMMKCREKAGLK